MENKQEGQQPPAEEKKAADANAAAKQAKDGAKADGAPVEEGAAEGEGEQEEEVVVKMALDEYYPEGHVEKVIPDSSLSKRTMKFYGCFGQSSYKRYNFHWLGDHQFIFVTANTYQILNIQTGERRIFHGKDTDGVGSISVHPSKKYFAVAEKGEYPNIYIYEFPSLKLYRICRKGTETMYAHVEFSTSGNMLASLGGEPDYTLTVWDWINQKVILKAKAFSQEIFRVSFSPFTDDILFTAGQGHIRFWKMAQTFTGLKLQGEIAKFGQLELSDVSSFYELADGKVVSGTEYGTMIVWEGQFVKAHLLLDVEENKPLHKGMIEVMIADGEFYITAGHDGYIKWWRITDIDTAEADEGLDFAIKPIKEVLIADDEEGKQNAHIVNMILADNNWYIQDGRGKIYVMARNSDIATEVYSFQEGTVNDLAVSPSHNYALSIGSNGMVKVWDYVRQKTFLERTFSGKGTCLTHLPHTDITKGRVCAAGFDNGIVRILSINADNIEILKSFKAHEDAIAGIKYSKDQKMCVTASVTGEIFFFQIDSASDSQKYEPLCCHQLPEGARVNDFKWNDADTYVLIGCTNGYVYQVNRPNPEKIDNSDSYEWQQPDIKEWRIKIMEFQMAKNQKKDEAEEEKKRRLRLREGIKEEEEPEEDWDPEPIGTILPFKNSQGVEQFIVTTQGNGKFSGFLYICQMDQIRPIKAIQRAPGVEVTLMSLDVNANDGAMLTIGYDNGNVEIIMDFNWDRRMSVKYHCGHTGSITQAVLTNDQSFFLTSATDGLIFCHQFDRKMACIDNQFDPLAGVEGANFMAEEDKKVVRAKQWADHYKNNEPVLPIVDHDSMGLEESSLAISMKCKEPVGIDITDPTMYSIQQSKLRTEEDHRLNLAEQKKEGVRKQINELREQFKQVADKNLTAEEHLQAHEDDFQIDPEFFALLYDRNEAKIEETKKEVAWGIEYHTVNLNKLKNQYYDVLEFEKFTVKAIKNESYVTTFRVHKMSEFLQKNIESFKQMLENEIIGKDADLEDDFVDDGSKDENKVDNEKQKEKEKQAALAAKQKAAQQAALNAKKSEGEKKREQRKLEREERKKKIDKLEKKEAQNSQEDPEDKREIEVAKATYGDFKMKTSIDYQVPENQRVNFSKKRQQMVLLEGSIHKLKVDFNQKIQELKIRKKEIVDHVLKLNERLTEINTELGVKEELYQPSIDKDLEYPENFFEIKDSDIDEFKAKLEAEKLKAKGITKKPEEEENGSNEKEDEEEAIPPIKDLQVIQRKNAKTQNTELDSEFAQIRKIELIYEKDQKKAEIDEITKFFDEEIKEMQKEKYRLESDLKNAEMKLVLFFEELILLKSMEAKDQQLTKRLAECRQQKGQILKDINEISRKLKDKKKEIDEIKEKEEDLMTRFHEYCPERSDRYEEIRKFFEKIIKRRRKIDKPEKTGEEDEEDEDEAEEEEEVEEDDEDDEEENTVAGLSQEEYKIEEIEKLREERLDLFEDKEKILSFITELEAQRKKCENKEKGIKQELDDTEEEIQDFQAEKLSKLNQLQVSVVLNIKQIQNLEENKEAKDRWDQIRETELTDKLQELHNKTSQEGNDDQAYYEQQRDKLLNEEDWRGYFMPKDLKNSILFTRTQLLQLINRKRELDEEHQGLSKLFKEYRKDQQTKKNEIKQNEKIRDMKEKEYRERQMLRFGSLVDLDNLEVSGPSGVVLELQNKFAKTEKRCIKMIEDAEAEFDQTQRKLTQEMKNNTNLLNLIRQLGEEELDLNKKLNDSNKAIFVDEDDEKKRTIMEEKLKIKKLLEIQAKEIETFKTEINMYKRKGGHIYTKVTTNRRVANLNQDN